MAASDVLLQKARQTYFRLAGPPPPREGDLWVLTLRSKHPPGERSLRSHRQPHPQGSLPSNPHCSHMHSLCRPSGCAATLERGGLGQEGGKLRFPTRFRFLFFLFRFFFFAVLAFFVLPPAFLISFGDTFPRTPTPPPPIWNAVSLPC